MAKVEKPRPSEIQWLATKCYPYRLTHAHARSTPQDVGEEPGEAVGVRPQPSVRRLPQLERALSPARLLLRSGAPPDDRRGAAAETRHDGARLRRRSGPRDAGQWVSTRVHEGGIRVTR